MDDDTYISAHIIDPEIPAEAVEEFFEAEAPAKPAAKPEKEKPAKEKPAKEETDDDELSWKDLQGMERKALKKVIKEKDLLTDPDDFEDDDDGLREAIAEELEIEVPEDDTDADATDADADAGEDYTWDDLKEMDFDELSELCKESGLDTDPDDFEEGDEDSEEKFRKAIAKECEIEVPEKKKKK